MCRLSMARSAALLPPTTDLHRCAMLPPSCGSVPGSRRSAVAGEPDFCLTSGLLRPPVRLRGPRCFSTYTLYGLCLDVNRVMRAILGTSQSPPPKTRVVSAWAGSASKSAVMVGRSATGTSHASRCKYSRTTTLRRVPGGRVSRSVERTQLRNAGVLLGLGLGGFFDGIVLHQLLQWHHMVSSVESFSPETVPGLRTNTLADGLFHAVTYIFTVLGVTLLWRAPGWRERNGAPALRVSASRLGSLPCRRGDRRSPAARDPPCQRDRPTRAMALVGSRVPALGCGDARWRLVALARQRRVGGEPWRRALTAVIREGSR
jgi:hypothetical protein